MTQVGRMPDAPASQPDFFVGWWEIVFHIRDGEQTDVTDIIEHVDAAGNFTVFRDRERIGAGHHVDFAVDPDSFTNVPEVAGAHTQTGRELAVYRCSGDVLEVCKASEHQGRPTSFASPLGSGWTHVSIRRLSDDDPRIPAGLRSSDHNRQPDARQEARDPALGSLPVGREPHTTRAPSTECC